MFKKVGIIGLGLIGGSIAKAVKNLSDTQNIVARDTNENSLIQAKQDGVLTDYSMDSYDVFTGCDLVFICTPVSIIPSIIKSLIGIVDKDCIITDVGSTKHKIYTEVQKIEGDFLYIGGHPMTGSERVSYNSAKSHLFENAYYVLCPPPVCPSDKIENLSQLIKMIGAIPIVIDSKTHDYVVASVSHVPHVVASALCHNLKTLDTKDSYMKLLAAGGFKDITRIASGDATMWQNISLDNSDEIVTSLDNLIEILTSIKTSVENSDKAEMYDFFEDGKVYRDSFTTITPGAYIKLYDIVVDVVDKTGAIADIAVLFASNNINIKNMSIENSRELYTGALFIAFNTEDDRQKSIKLLRELNYDVHIKE